MSTASRRSASCMVVALLVAPAAAAPQTGTIIGTVTISGAVPSPQRLSVTTDRDSCGETVLARDVVVRDGSLANAVAFVEGIEGETEPGEYSLGNSDCLFDPPVLAATVGSELVVANHDEMMHNTHLFFRYGSRRRTVGNWGLPREGAIIRNSRALRRPGIIDVECDVHPWMHATIRVFDHPHFAISSQSGAFEISGVPVGEHTLKVWHEVFGELQQSVTVEVGVTTTVSFEFSADNVGQGSP